MDAIRYLANRFKEPSSYGGLSPLLVGIGYAIPAGTLQSAIYVMSGICGLVAFFLPEKK